MNKISIKSYPYGTINSIEANSIPRGALSASLNFITLGDKLEVRRGSYLMGTRQTGTGSIKGLETVKNRFGTEKNFIKRGKKLLYLNPATEDFAECGTDIFGTAGENEIMFVDAYNFLAGDQVWIGTPSTGPFKIMMANPTDVVDQYDATKNFHGYLKVDRNRMLSWGDIKNKNNPRHSFIDTQNYTTVTTEAIAGSGATRTGTLAFKAAGTKRTCFAVTFTDGTEDFTDNFDGTLTGSAGGTGTINYATGAYSITFNAAAITVTSTYQWEDSTNDGIADFSMSPTRVEGEGNIYLQPEGGELMNVGYYNGTLYCMHRTITYELTVATDDSTYTNIPYREKVGIPYPLAMLATGDGIYYIDERNSADPDIRVLTLDSRTTKVVPQSITKNRKFEGVLTGLNLTNYLFDSASFEEFGSYILMGCRTKTGTSVGQNNRMILYNRDNKAIHELDYSVSFMDTLDGALIAGDSLTENVYKLFSGFDDDDANIAGYAQFNIDSLDNDGRKKCRQLILKGEIATDQEAKVYISANRGDFVEIVDDDGDSFLKGTGDYVDVGNPQTVGNNTIGQNTVGGGDAVTAYHYERAVKLGQDKFNDIQVKVVLQGLGYFSLTEHAFYDIRYKDSKIAKKYRN